MSKDEKTTKKLVQVAQDGKDGKDGYAKGAEELASSDQPALAPVFQRLSTQRAGFAQELEALAAQYGDDAQEGSSAVAALHRGWMHLRDAITGSGPEAVLKTAERGEEHAISAYEDALNQDLSPTLKELVQRQLTDIKAARAEVHGLLEQSATS
jgi:uncharacterized protein (TIGR02284 family)